MRVQVTDDFVTAVERLGQPAQDAILQVYERLDRLSLREVRASSLVKLKVGEHKGRPLYVIRHGHIRLFCSTGHDENGDYILLVSAATKGKPA